MGGRERLQRNHSHAEKPSAAIARNRRIHSTGAAPLVLTTVRRAPGGGVVLASDSLGSPVASSSAATITVIAVRAVNATRASGLRRPCSRLGGAGMIPRSLAQEAANDRGSEALAPRYSSAETPSASASSRSEVRSAAIS